MLEHLLSTMQELQHLYLLEHKVKRGWFLIDYMMTPKSDGSAAIWFPDRKIAVAFDTEETVEEFKSKYIAPRPVAIVKVKVGDFVPKRALVIS